MAESGRTRYGRGAQRRTALIKAAAELLLDHGLAALSHRAVAAHAALPLASTTYYFASADELQDEALHYIAQGWVARASEVVNALPDNLDACQAVQAVVRIVGADAPSERMLLVYERYLESGRNKRLRPVVLDSNARLEELVRQVLLRADLPTDEATVRLVLAVADGAAVAALAEGTLPITAVGESLSQLLSLLRSSTGEVSPRPVGSPGS